MTITITQQEKYVLKLEKIKTQNKNGRQKIKDCFALTIQKIPTNHKPTDRSTYIMGYRKVTLPIKKGRIFHYGPVTPVMFTLGIKTRIYQLDTIHGHTCLFCH